MRIVAPVLAFLLAVVAVAVLVQCLHDRDDARHELAAARMALRHERATSSTAATDLRNAQRVMGTLDQELPMVVPAATAVATFDDQDLDAVRAALRAGVAGDLDAYNRAVDQRSGVDPQHDDALEQLRQHLNALITALDQLRG